MPRRISSLLVILGPGLLVAATGVGAGDLATAGFAGSRLGVAVVWAVLLGAAMKFVLNEGLARWQLATGTTLLEGVAAHVGRWAILLFLIYLLPFAFFVGGALMSATGVATHALLGWPGDPAVARPLWGAVVSAVAALLAWKGGFALFERTMAIAVATMFVAVVFTAVRLGPDLGAIVAGLVPAHPGRGESLEWTISLIGGVGGTVTVLCYGYWMRQAGRGGPEALPTCRIDLFVAYAATALFGVAMLSIASRIEIGGGGARLLVELAAQLGESLGPTGRLIFLVGAWAAIVSSLLGVWQSVPMLFADALQSLRGTPPVDPAELPRTRTYRWFLLAIATVPLLQTTVGFAEVQKAYALFGAYFLPMLAVALLVLNGRGALVGGLRNHPLTALALLGVLAFFVWAALEGIAVS